MIETMEFSEFLEFLAIAREKEREENIYLQWCGMLPTLGEYMTFQAFKEKVTGANIDTRPTDVIIREIEELHRKQKGQTDGA